MTSCHFEAARLAATELPALKLQVAEVIALGQPVSRLSSSVQTAELRQQIVNSLVMGSS